MNNYKQFYYIQVKTDSLYNRIRLDMWKTPVQCSDENQQIKFKTYEDALNFLKYWNLVSTFYVHQIWLYTDLENLRYSTLLISECTYGKDKSGNFILIENKV